MFSYLVGWCHNKMILYCNFTLHLGSLPNFVCGCACWTQKIAVCYTYKRHNFGTLQYTIFCRKTLNLGQIGSLFAKYTQFSKLGAHAKYTQFCKKGTLGQWWKPTHWYTKFHENTPQKAGTLFLYQYILSIPPSSLHPFYQWSLPCY